MKNKYIFEIDSQFDANLKEENLIQRDNFVHLYEILGRIRGKFENAYNKNIQVFENITSCHTNNTILVSGPRGSGKSVFLNNISAEKVKDEYELLDVIDPTILANTKEAKSTEAFCSVLIGHLHKHVCALYDKGYTGDYDGYFAKFRELAEALGSMQDAKDDHGIDAIYDNQNALQLEQLIHEYFKLTSKYILGNRILCYRIDDIDMTLSNGYYILEAIRKYLSSPYVVVIISGDFQLYCQIVKNNLEKDLFFTNNYNEKSTSYNTKSTSSFLPDDASDDLTNKYLDKVLPINNRLQIIDFRDFLEKNYNEIIIKTANNQFTLDEIENFIDILFNPSINEQFRDIIVLTSRKAKHSEQKFKCESLLKDNLRSWMQFHQRMYPLYDKYLSKGISKSVDFATEDHNILYREFQNNVFNFFSSYREFRMIAEMARINLQATNREVVGYDVSLAIQELENSEIIHITLEGELKGTSTGIARNLLLSRKNINRVLEKDDDRYLLIFYLFVVPSFLYNSKNEYYLFSGRFVEVVLSTLNLDITTNKERIGDLFSELSLRRPIFSILNQHVEEIDMSIEQVENNQESIEERDEEIKLLSEYFVDTFDLNNRLKTALRTIVYNSDKKLINTFFDIHLIILSLDQYFNDLNNYRLEIKSGTTLSDYIFNCVYLFLKSIAFYERKDYVRIENGNTTEKKILRIIRTDYKESNINGKKSLVYLIYSHPIIQTILDMLDDEVFQIKIIFVSSQDEKFKKAKVLLDKTINEMSIWKIAKVGRKRTRSNQELREAYKLLRDTQIGEVFRTMLVETGWFSDMLLL